MASFVDFLERLLTEGTVILRARPRVAARELAAAERLLAAAYEDHRLDVAGPPIDFDLSAALAAAQQVWFGCWFLLQRGDLPEEMERVMPPLPPPGSAAQHLSTDLVLRFVPQILSRSRNVDPADILSKRLEQLLRSHPLSGVLADIEEEPLIPLHLGDHPGLLLLYAERLAEKMRPGWVPAGPALASVEMIFTERGLPVPEPLPSLPSRQPN